MVGSGLAGVREINRDFNSTSKSYFPQQGYRKLILYSFSFSAYCCVYRKVLAVVTPFHAELC
jgi:hypothetical protein